MDRRSFLRTILNMGNQDTALDSSMWKRLVLGVTGFVILIGIVLLVTNYSHIYLRLSSIALIFVGLSGYMFVLTSLVANRYYRTWPIILGSIVAILLFLAGCVFFMMSLQY